MNENGWSSDITVEAQHIFRFRCQHSSKLIMISGEAELDGSELPLDNMLSFEKGDEGSIVTFSGCTLKYEGTNFQYLILTFVEDNSCSNIYLNIHSALEIERDNPANTTGPRVMVCGNRNAGKKTLSQILVNYRIRSFGKIIFIDLNVNSNHICIPGSMAALVVTHIYDINNGWSIEDEPLLFNYGYTTPLTDLELFMLQVKTMSYIVQDKLKADPELNKSGIIVNMSSLDDGVLSPPATREQKADAMIKVAHLLRINYVLVIEDGFLEQTIRRAVDTNVTVVRIPRTSSEYLRDNICSLKKYQSRVKSYFEGQGSYKLSVTVFHLYVNKFHLFTYDSADSESKDRLFNPKKMAVSKKLIHALLAVSQANRYQDLAIMPIYGYVMIVEIAKNLKSIRVITPSGEPLPSNYLIFSHFKVAF